MGGAHAWARAGAIVVLFLACTCQGRRVQRRRQLLAPAMATATTSALSMDLAYISGNLTNITADANATAASVAICAIADSNSSTTVQTIAQGFAAVLINGTHGNATGQALSLALANTTNTTQQNVAQGYATGLLAFYAANYTKVHLCNSIFSSYLLQNLSRYLLDMCLLSCLLGLKAAAEAIGAALAVGQTGVVEAANAAAFSTSNSSAIATANATATALAADNGTCSSYPAQSYTEALEQAIAANETEAAAAGIAAGFAQGCCVGSATTVAVLDYIAQYGCNGVVGGDLLSKPYCHLLLLLSMAAMVLRTKTWVRKLHCNSPSTLF